MEKWKVYISGKITGIEKYAAIIFESAEKSLINEGFEVVNPMKLPHNHDKSWNSYMKEDIKALLDCDEIYLLENWMDSKGANLERNIASAIGLKISRQTVPFLYSLKTKIIESQNKLNEDCTTLRQKNN